MPKAHKSRSGSMQYWPRKRAKRSYARVRAWADIKDALPLGFAGYKAGMTHIIVADNRKNSKSKGGDMSIPVTVIECPPIKIFSALFYKYDVNKWLLKKEISFKADKELARKLKLPKDNKASLDNIKLEDYDDVRIKVYTQPKLTGIGKKKPEVFEIFTSAPSISSSETLFFTTTSSESIFFFAKIRLTSLSSPEIRWIGIKLSAPTYSYSELPSVAKFVIL